MRILIWIASNPIIAFVIGALIVFPIIQKVFYAGSKDAWTCPNCGHKGAK